jgi:hypothetical protein
MAQAKKALVSLGYKDYATCENEPNPWQKAPFVSGELASGFSAHLMTSKSRLPSFELLQESSGIPPGDLGPSAFQAIVSDGNQQSDTTFATTAVAEGISAVGNSDEVVAATHLFVQVAVNNIEASVSFWQDLGYQPELQTNGEVQVHVKGGLAGASLDLVFRQTDTRHTTWLNQRGLVCISFLCLNLLDLREQLVSLGHTPGEYFRAVPFGRPILVFFVKGPNGEIYEFLSPER